ncbi:MAG: endopeptidase La [Anaerolineae bacterium]|jgi:ATP-dependent Lon protease|nr:endopeptidase La [Anaerolineae bacterium]MBT7075611.1 endopeptidase La [Anaerolineae bacterium]MBT7783755.1 endopeptidase La [Anaerolineae bacterium]
MDQNDWLLEDEDNFGVSLSQRTEELYRVPNREVDSEGLIEAWAVPLRDLVIFPRMVSPIFVGRETSLLAIQEAQENDQTVIGLTQRDADIDKPGESDFLPVGVEMAVGRLLNMSDGASSALVQGRRRVEIVEYVQIEPFIRVRVRPINEPKETDAELEALMRSVRDSFEKCVNLDRALPEEAHLFALNINEPGWLADMVASAMAIDSVEKQKLLLLLDPAIRLKRLNLLLAQEVNVLELEDKIHAQVQSSMSKNQREFYLREQLKTIQEELGEGDIWQQDAAELREKIKKAKLTKEARETAEKELTRLAQMPPMAPEVGIIRTYLEWIIDLPWKSLSKDRLNVKTASKILDRDHYGLKKVKDRILEYIAVRSLKPKKDRQPILCFVGAPGTGKTSMGRSIAESLGREFVRVSLGGVRDVSEIRGHRRTYIGALPGRILQTIKRAGKNNPLFMLDEIDKLGSDFRGDPSSALLEVLDPEQNNAFSDHYLEIPYDLSKVMFITTANSLHSIPDALLDRMEVIEFPGYIEEEKLKIAEQYLIPRQLEESGVDDLELRFSGKALQSLIRQYTYEAGVRNLEREIGRIFRKIARLKAESKRFPQQISEKTVEKLLGPPDYFMPEIEENDQVGVATGLAWTMNGGEIMSIEVAILEGKGNLQITGNIGDVMQESVQAGLTYIKSRAENYDIPLDVFDRMDIHLHMPEAAIPKDGPSAGITLTSALLSALTGHAIYHDVAMTGEVTLRGRVLPVGGVRDKVLAAHRAGMKVVMLPEKNMKDLVDIPKSARNELKILPVKHMDQVLDIALSPEQMLEPPRPPEKEEEE